MVSTHQAEWHVKTIWPEHQDALAVVARQTVLFDQLLGITRKHYLVLKDALLQGAKEQGVAAGQPSEHGQKFEMRLEMSGATGVVNVLSVWLVEKGTEYPRLITCYVE